MWIKVLPALPTKESYFTQVPDEIDQAWEQIRRLIRGLPEVVKTQTLVNKYGFNTRLGLPEVVMVVNENGQRSGMPINERASAYYPNEYDIKIRGDAVLTGWTVRFVEGEVGCDISDMPLKWKVIHDMETILADNRKDAASYVHSLLDELLLSVADPDVAQMYKEAREQFDWRM